MSRETVVDLKIEIRNLRDQVKCQEQVIRSYEMENNRLLKDCKVAKQNSDLAITLVRKVLLGEFDQSRIAAILLYFARELPDLLVKASGDYTKIHGVDLHRLETLLPLVDSQLEQRMISELKKNRKIPAIKTYREATGCSLKEAKDAVDVIEREMDLD